MARRSVDAVGSRHFRTLYRVGVIGDLTDGQLLERFVAGRDEAAEAGFAALVERHGPMVLRVCRQILGDAHDAEDAFQATFLVLARRAASVRKRDSVASWLFGIAQRLAMRSRADAARRRAHERRRAELMATTAESPGNYQCDRPECWPELHEEVARLPEKYRESVVLCYLEGLTTAAAARRLGCAQGTVLSRLSRARERLRRRLTRRGLAQPAGLLLAGLSPDAATAVVPAALAHSVVQAAMRVAAGTTAAGAVSASVAALTEGALTMMFLARLKGFVGVVLAAGVLTVGMAMVVHRTAGARPQDPPASESVTAAPLVPRAGDPSRTKGGPAAEIIVRAADLSRVGEDDRFMSMAAIDPTTATWRTIYKGYDVGPGPVSPDGRYVVYSSVGRTPDPEQVGIWVYDMTGETRPRRIFERKGVPFWVNDGRQVIIGAPVGAGYRKFETWRVNADGTGRTKLPIPETDLVLDCSRDGTWLATRTIGGEPRHRGRLTLVHPDGTGARHLTEGSPNDDLFSIFKISPDGRSVAYVEVKTVGEVRSSRLFVVDIEGRQRREIPIPFEPDTAAGVSWSPDGSRLALNSMSGRTKEGSICLVDRDGSNFRKLPLPPGRWNLHVCDWTAITPRLRVGAPDETPDLKTPRGRYQALLQEYKTAFRAYDEARQKAKTDEERKRVFAEKYPQPRTYLGRFLQFAESAPNDPAALDALVWIIQRGFDGPEFSRAIDRLVDHAESRYVGRDALSLASSVSPSAEKLLRAVIEKAPDPYTKGLACLALGRYFKRSSERVHEIREDSESAKRWEAMFVEEGAGKEGFARFIARDPDALMKQAELALERVASEFGKPSNDEQRLSRKALSKLAEDAQAELDEIRNLCPGKPAPEIAGTDVDGQTFKLSDYRGKVVLISFWADWCGSCRDMYALERSLLERMRGRPFVLLGVNGDGDRIKLQERMKVEHITARSWWDGGGSANTPGPIARRFNIHGWPTLYLLDHRGVIRHKFPGTPSTPRLIAVIDALVRAAEQDADAR